jgi:subtilisin family serine protease
MWKTTLFGRRLLVLALALFLAIQPMPCSAKAQKSGDTSTIAAKSTRKVAPDLDAAMKKVGNDSLPQGRVIIQPSPTAPRNAISAKLASLGGRVRQTYRNLNLISAELPLSRVRELEADAAVAWISTDRTVQATGFVEATTGAAQSRTLKSGATMDGAGIGIAIIDSGVYASHSAFASLTRSNSILYSKDFTGAGIGSDDLYGHGSHVATLASGGAGFASGAYTGIAPGANLLNLRVLDSAGQGSASHVIAALDWCITNQTAYNIRVINLSLGALAVESYQTDPLCVAARRAYSAGIVVVAAAGNAGRSEQGEKLYGGIHSPGIDPAVITVGAANTFDTIRRSDDVITSYSSRGPTRGYAVDASGVNRYDNLLKPDLVAPGNRLIAAQSSGGTSNAIPNTLIQLYPELDTAVTAVKVNKTMYLSGTSMAAPVVAGAAALLWQANPTLTPGLIKAILMYTAQPLRGFNTLEQGAGLLNIEGAVRLALLVKPNVATLANGTAMLTASLPTSQTSLIAEETCYWGQGVLSNYCFLYGSKLLTQWQGMYAQGLVLADAIAVINGQLKQVAGLTSNGVSQSQGVILNSGLVLADGQIIAEGLVLADGVTLAQGLVLADGRLIADGIVMADGSYDAEGISRAENWLRGDPTASMQPVIMP